jgi:hypothetical protein
MLVLKEPRETLVLKVPKVIPELIVLRKVLRVLLVLRAHREPKAQLVLKVPTVL